MCSTSVSPIDKSERQSNAKETKSKDIGSPGFLDRKNRRLSHSNVSSQRQSTGSSPHEVPYARLIDSPSNVNRVLKKPNETITKSPTLTTRYDSDIKLLTPKSWRMPTPISSASESKLTADHFQKSDTSVSICRMQTFFFFDFLLKTFFFFCFA